MSRALRAVQPAFVAAASASSDPDLQQIVFSEIQKQAGPIATANNMPHLLPVDEGSLGDLPWSWQNGTSFNAKTYQWLNNIFAYSSDGYVSTNGEALTTEYANVLQDTHFVLDPADAAAFNQANLAANATVNTVITDWVTKVGAFPSTVPSTQIGQLGYIMSQILTWGTPGLTLGQLRSSTNPNALLKNIPLGADKIVADTMTYLAQTSSVASIQAAVVSFNAQVAAALANTDPQPQPTSVTPGFMQTIDDTGSVAIVPRIDIAESAAQLQNALLPSSGGTTITASFTATSVDTNTVHINNSSGGGASGGLGFFLSIGGSSSSSTDIFSFVKDVKSCQVNLTFNGVTTFTPVFSPYNISTGAGWWLPDPIEEAANPVPNQSGYAFSPKPQHDFGVKGDFGVIKRLLISQQPVISLTYAFSDYNYFQEIVQKQTSWGVSFLGIAFGGGSSTYYSATTSQNLTAGTVTLTMSPVGITTPIAASDQLAYVIGAQILWPGASATQNAAGI